MLEEKTAGQPAESEPGERVACRGWPAGAVPRQLLVVARAMAPEVCRELQTRSGRSLRVLWAGPEGRGPEALRAAGLEVRVDVASGDAAGEQAAEGHARDMAVLWISENATHADWVGAGRRAHATVAPVLWMPVERVCWPRAEEAAATRWRKHLLFCGPWTGPSALEAELLQRVELDLGARALEEHPVLRGHLGRACVEGLKRRQWDTVLTDAAMGGRSIKGGELLAAGWELAEQLKKRVRGKRVGVALPPGLAGTLVNLALLWAGKVPVNVNFTIGRAAAESCLRQAGIETVMTAAVLRGRLKEFPWPEHTLDAVELLKGLNRTALGLKRARVLLQSARSLGDALGLPERGGDQEAGLLFTSGSSDEPKGVPLTHRNLLANMAQVQAALPMEKLDSLLGCLPYFHSFGYTVTLWWPLVSGPRVVTQLSPLEAGKLAEAVQAHGVNLIILTPTFLRGFMKKAKREQLASVRMVVTGAEKLPAELREGFEKQFGIAVSEGYGLTETTPVISVNLPERRRAGSVGPLLPGVSVRVRAPGEDRELPLGEQGVLCFRGANVFRGYLDQPEKSREVLQDGWFLTGDLGRLDADGFLFIEGRLSRFSKIGGEMVPHGTVERYLTEFLRELPGGGEAQAVVMAVQDQAKGEALVALVTGPVDVELLRKDWLRRGLPNLWMPKVFRTVKEVPLLASGKLDLRRCRELAEGG